MENKNKNVIIFGVTGTGKSSVTNMLMGEKVAKTSDSAVGCTFSFERYTKVNNYYDTAGLNEGTFGLIDAKEAIKSLIRLLKSLKTGINLLILTVEMGRINDKTEKNYKLFVETLCRNKVPVILVITKCEDLSDMTEWWVENKTYFVDKYNMQFADTVCVCASTGDDEDEDECDASYAQLMQRKFNESKVKLTASINKFALQKGWRIESLTEWIIITIKRMMNFFRESLSISQIPLLPEFKDWIKDHVECTEEEAVKIANEMYINP